MTATLTCHLQCNFLKKLGTAVFSKQYSNRSKIVGDYFQQWMNPHLLSFAFHISSSRMSQNKVQCVCS